MRICMLAGNPLAHDGRVLRHAEALQEAGHEVTVLGVVGPNDSASALQPAPRFRVFRLDRRRRGIVPRLTWLATATRRHLARLLAERLGAHGLRAMLMVSPCALELTALAALVGADVYHSNDLDTLPPAAWASRLRGGRYVYDAHELYTDESPALTATDRQARRSVEEAFIGGAAAVMTVNDLIAEELTRMYRVQRPVVVRNVPPLVPLRRWRDGSRSEALSLLLHGTFVGLDQAGIDETLRAVAQVEQAWLLLRGRATDRPALLRRIADLGLSGRVRHEGRLPGPVALIKSAMEEGHDLGLSVHLPDCKSRRYATSSKVFEYQMAGLGVVASDQEGNRSILDEDAGVFFIPGDANDLAHKLRGLLRDRGRLAGMKEAARRRAETEFCWERERGRLLSIYGERR